MCTAWCGLEYRGGINGTDSKFFKVRNDFFKMLEGKFFMKLNSVRGNGIHEMSF
ncbi:hypothetical protein ADIARSV_1660 [Arcticibacter svalbardensis MN12-7]|uniref:Uncharacterized protein n=1 Tax=Arcticibacter svalbardensis MN12-7 TaxID=1150600 RepID=R9GTL8_9SPHI|nr:hypothetical protein ADIARSV_1660 [Arcticibacter svalbardensis MN12-7]